MKKPFNARSFFLSGVLLFLVGAMWVGCDTFTPGEALLDLPDASTDESLLVTDSTWTAVAYVATGKAYESRFASFEARFAESGRVSGHTGCSAFGGRYWTTANGSLGIIDVIQNANACSDKQRQNESEVTMSVFLNASRFETKGNTLQLHTGDGDGIRLEQDNG